MTAMIAPLPRQSALNANLICMASMLIWAAALPAADFLIGNVPPVALTAMRMGLAGVFLLPIWLAVEGPRVLRGASWLKGIGIGAILAIGALCLVVSQKMTDAVTVSIIAALLPVVGMGIEVAFDGRRITRALIVGILLALVGGTLAYAAKLSQFGLGLGALIALISNLTYALGSRFSVTALPDMTPLGRVTLTLLGAGMASTLVALAQEATVGGGEWGVFGWPQVAALAVFAIGGMAISQLLWIASIGRLGIGVSSLHINAAAFYVMIFAWLLGAPWNWLQVVGALIVGAGVLVAQGVIPLGSRHAKP